MQKKIQHKAAIFFTILFLGIIVAPSIIVSIDDSVDIAFFYGENEEEEAETENFKLLFELQPQSNDNYFLDTLVADLIVYTFKTYQKPHLNLVSPPPESVL